MTWSSMESVTEYRTGSGSGSEVDSLVSSETLVDSSDESTGDEEVPPSLQEARPSIAMAESTSNAFAFMFFKSLLVVDLNGYTLKAREKVSRRN